VTHPSLADSASYGGRDEVRAMNNPKKKDQIRILAIETSCDETAAAVVTAAPTELRIQRNYEITNSDPSSQAPQDDIGCFPVVLSNIISSQIDLHAKTGGIVPEVASRAHTESIIAVINEALIAAQSRKSKVENQNYGVDYSKKLTAESPQLKADLLKQITHIAVTAGPGLIGSLLVGFNTAKTLAYGLDIPIIPINHIEGHIYSALCTESLPNYESKRNYENTDKASSYKLTAKNFPILALTVSGGHTSLTLMKGHGVYENIGSTRDDAAGEAFDKVAQLLGLGFPGGPAISKLAEKFRTKALQASEASEACKLELPRPMIDEPNFDFSFSGLKTAVLLETNKRKITHTDLIHRKDTDRESDQRINGLTDNDREEIAYSFEEAVVDVLVTKTIRAAKKYGPKAILLAGGVAANKRLREELVNRLLANPESEYRNPKQILNSNDQNRKFNVHNSYFMSHIPELLIAPLKLCGDNAAMIGLAAFYRIVQNDTKKWDGVEVNSNLSL
jgi:N6-L-threonylcarbamoyladenine synthase